MNMFSLKKEKYGTSVALRNKYNAMDQISPS
jgi:hypothetical protein